mgnify:CR=1 FL=1
MEGKQFFICMLKSTLPVSLTHKDIPGGDLHRKHGVALRGTGAAWSRTHLTVGDHQYSRLETFHEGIAPSAREVRQQVAGWCCAGTGTGSLRWKVKLCDGLRLAGALQP